MHRILLFPLTIFGLLTGAAAADGGKLPPLWRFDWAPYLSYQFVDGLSARDKPRHWRLVESGACGRAAILGIEGLVALHPELQHPLTALRYRAYALNQLLPRHSHADRYCRARRVLEPLVLEARRIDDNIYTLVSWVTGNLHDPKGPITTNERLIGQALITMEWLAICHHYVPALSYMASRGEQTIYFYTHDQNGLYLHFLAEKLGFKTPGLAKIRALHPPPLPDADIAAYRSAFIVLSAEEASRKLRVREKVCGREVDVLP